jgi:hypothetical protein
VFAQTSANRDTHSVLLRFQGLLAIALATLACLASAVSAAQSSQSQVPGPPHGLTAYGHLIWELDALLHDNFGEHTVYLRYGTATLPGKFTRNLVPDAVGGTYSYTFADASHSVLKLKRPKHPPKIVTPAASLYSDPLTISSKYISCGRNLWLYSDGDAGQANLLYACASGSNAA